MNGSLTEAMTEARPARRATLAGMLALVLAMVAGCASTGTSLPALPDDPAFASVTDPDARQLLQRGLPIEAADVYSRRAASATDEASRQDDLLVAAEILYDRGLREPGRERLDAVPLQLASLELAQRRDILTAKALLLDDDAQGAVDALPAPVTIDSALHRARVYETRAQAFRRLGDADQELVSRIGLEEQLDDPRIIERSQAGIWLMLTELPLSTLQRLTTNVRSDVYQGWIELALANADLDVASPQGGRDAALAQWRTLFPDHPANDRFIASLARETRFGGISGDGRIDRIAVLLPLTDGRTAAAAAAIRDGLIAAREQDRSRGRAVPDVRFYDVGANPGFARSAFESAVRDGANAIVGPLRKEAVAAIVTQRRIQVPTVTLNTVEQMGAGGARENAIQFGLAPEDEARAAARRATSLSLNNAIVLQSDDSRGDREARAFQEAMFARGGDVVHVGVLPGGEYDFSEQIRQALAIDDSDARFRTLSSTIGKRLFHEPAIRNDVDVVFMAMSNEEARSVRPQLDFFRAGAVPRLATSRVSSLVDDEKRDRDLNGVFYVDAPWVLDASLDEDPLKQALVQRFPDAAGGFGKLYALGIDAWTIVTSLDALVSGQQLPGYTGRLTLEADGVVHRDLDWARYQEGVSTPVESVDMPDNLPRIGDG